jgi:hypothetical protein
MPLIPDHLKIYNSPGPDTLVRKKIPSKNIKEQVKKPGFSINLWSILDAFRNHNLNGNH